MSLHVFVSYLPDTQPLAENLVNALEHEGIECWAAFKDLRAGQNFKDEFERAASTADWFVIVVRPKSRSTSWQEYEWRLALNKTWEDKTKRILPVIVGPGSAADLREWVPLHLEDPPRSADWMLEVARVLKSDNRSSTVEADPEIVRQRERRFAEITESVNRLWEKETNILPAQSKG